MSTSSQPSAPSPQAQPPASSPELTVFYGGTFDPVHNGHLAIARAARDALDTNIRLMPAADPPHRPPPGATVADRVEMLRLAITQMPGLCIDMREIKRGGRSYSIDTLHALRAELGNGVPVALLLGADSFLDLPHWKDWRDLFTLAHFIVARRPGSPLDTPLPPDLAREVSGRQVDSRQQLQAAPCGKVFFLGQPLHAQSATEIRHRIATGLPWRDALPAAVADYILANGLYGATSGAAGNGAVIRT